MSLECLRHRSTLFLIGMLLKEIAIHFYQKLYSIIVVNGTHLNTKSRDYDTIQFHKLYEIKLVFRQQDT